MTDIKQATRELMEALDHGYRVICVHYSCENFHDVTDRPVAISAIGITEIMDASGERNSQVFSITNSAANDQVVEREKEFLKRFFEFAKERPDARWVHWNMNNATYGFSALIARYRFLLDVDPPSVFSSDRIYDLDSIVGARYGVDFAKHPKLRSLVRLTAISCHFSKRARMRQRPTRMETTDLANILQQRNPISLRQSSWIFDRGPTNCKFGRHGSVRRRTPRCGEGRFDFGRALPLCGARTIHTPRQSAHYQDRK